VWGKGTEGGAAPTIHFTDTLCGLNARSLSSLIFLGLLGQAKRAIARARPMPSKKATRRLSWGSGTPSFPTFYILQVLYHTIYILYKPYIPSSTLVFFAFLTRYYKHQTMNKYLYVSDLPCALSGLPCQTWMSDLPHHCLPVDRTVGQSD
jgi:hypothetical protein